MNVEVADRLAFGGRGVVGHGFGVPLVVRYLLQICSTVAEARDILSRLPFHLAHTLTLVDRTGEFVTAFLSPDRGAVFSEVGVATNHQGDVEWHEHARATLSLERERLIAIALEEAGDPQSFADAFLRPPLYSAAYDSGMVTLYTAVYKPARGAVEYRWPTFTWEQSFERFREGSRTVRLLETNAA
jgi:predicted choloylglycine hydrolase